MSARVPTRCPRCWGWIPNNENPGAHPGALSRVDNETEICSACGMAESLGRIAWGNPGLIDVWQVTFEEADKTFFMTVELASLEGREPWLREKATVMMHAMCAFMSSHGMSRTAVPVDAVVIETKIALGGAR